MRSMVVQDYLVLSQSGVLFQALGNMPFAAVQDSVGLS
jgi:hypothetical protein